MENPYDEDDFRTPAWNLLSGCAGEDDDVMSAYEILKEGLAHLHKEGLDADNPLFVLWAKVACSQPDLEELNKDIASLHAAWSQFFNWLITLDMLRQMEHKFDLEPWLLETKSEE